MKEKIKQPPENLWEFIQSLYKRYFNIPPSVVDLMAIEGIIKLVANGYSNKHVAKDLELEIEYIEEVIKEYLKFPGWIEDLDIIPYQIYSSLGGDYHEYNSMMRIVSDFNKDKINLTFNICRE